MEGIPRKPLVKNEETLKQQFALTNEVSEAGTLSIPEAYKEYPLASLEKIVMELREKPLHELNIEEYKLVTQYPLYLDNLRALRRQQTNQIQTALEQVESETERREAFLSSISWSGPIQEKILERMESIGDPFTARLSADAQIIEASRTREGFLDMLRKYTNLRPGVIVNSLSEISPLLSREEVDELIQKCVQNNPTLSAQYASQLFQFYGDEFREMFLLSATFTSDKSFIYALASNEDLRNRIGSEKVEEVVSMILSQDLSVLDSVYREDIFKLDLVSPAVLNKLLAEKLPAFPEYSVMPFIKGVWPHLDSVGKEVCKNVATEKFQMENNRYVDLKSYEGILDAEILRGKIREIVLSSTDTHQIPDFAYFEKNLSVEEIQEWMHEYLHGGKKNYTLIESCSEYLMESDVLSEPDKQLFVERLLTESPRQVFRNPDIFLFQYAPEERQEVMVRLAAESSVYDGIRMLADWLPYMAGSAEEQKAILIEYCLRDADLSFLSWYQDESQAEPHQVLFRTLIDTSDLVTIIKKKAEVNTGAVLFKVREIRSILGGDENLKILIDSLRTATPFAFFESLSFVVYLYTPTEIERIIGEHIHTHKYGLEIFKHIEDWAPRLDPEKVEEICEANMDTLCLVPRSLDWYLKMVPGRAISDFIPIILKKNPAVALYFFHGRNEGEEYRKAATTISPEAIRDAALAEAESSPLKNTLKEFWTTFDMKSVRDPENNHAELRRIFFYYVHLSELSRDGLYEVLQRVLSEKPHNSKSEQQVFQNVISYLHLQKMGIFKKEDAQEIKTAEDIENALVVGMSQMLDIDEEITESHRTKFLRVMGTPGPFLTYLAQYTSSSDHKGVLKNIFASIAEDRFTDWKYGSQGQFDTFRKDGLVPAQLHEAQYENWKVDEKTALFETLKASGEEVAAYVKKLLLDNTEHLGVDIAEAATNDPGAALLEVKQQLILLGPRLAELGKQVSLFSKNPEASEEVKQAVMHEKANLEKLRNLLTLHRDLIRMTSLTPEEIVSGYIVEVGKSAQSLQTFLASLRDRVPTDGQFVIDQIISQVSSLREQGAEKENIVCEDTADPKTTLEIGAVPVESCQHYENGSYNECLLGYTEPNTKILVVRNGKGNIIARSILRLLSSEGGKPVLHVERVYSTSAGAGVQKALFEHAYKKAVSLNVPLSAHADDVLEHLNFTSGEKVELFSRTSRAPKVYVDSAGGSKSWGNYRIHDSVIVARK